MTSPTLSVVIPTFNCRNLMARHLDTIDGWIDLASEVFVVDSRSTDGTLELIRERLCHPNLIVVLRDRGLYQSWNEGIRATSGDWVYVSTAGDTIEREQLVHLLETGERLGADVVVSSPRFTWEDGIRQHEMIWPPLMLIQRFGLRQPVVFDPGATQYLALESYPNAILGSSASNLYRGAHIRTHPFPTDHGRNGDTAWIVRFGHETRYCLTPRVGSTFCFHAVPNPDGERDHSAMLDREIDKLQANGQVGHLACFFIEEELPALRHYKHALMLRDREWFGKRPVTEKVVCVLWAQARCFRRKVRLWHAAAKSRRMLSSALLKQQKIQTELLGQ